MSEISQIMAHVEALQKDYASLMQTANKLAVSSVPSERALAYEIGIFVANQTAATKKILQDITPPEVVSQENGYGALVD